MIVLCGIKFLNGHCADLHTYKYSGGVVCVSVCVAGEDTKHTDGRRDNIEGGQSLSI